MPKEDKVDMAAKVENWKQKNEAAETGSTDQKTVGGDPASEEITGGADEAQPGRNPLYDWINDRNGARHWQWQLNCCELVLSKIAANNPGDYEGFEAQFKDLAMKHDNAIRELTRKLSDWREGAANHFQLTGDDRGGDGTLKI